MGFFSKIFNPEIPHRKFAIEAKEICTSLQRTNLESNLSEITKHNLEYIIKRRISFRVDLVNFLLNTYEKSHPNSDAGAALGCFFQIISDEYLLLPENIKPDDYPGSIYPSIEDIVIKFIKSINSQPDNTATEFIKLYYMEQINIITRHFKDNCKKIGLIHER